MLPWTSSNSNTVHICDLNPRGLIFVKYKGCSLSPFPKSPLGTKHTGKAGKKKALQPSFQKQAWLGCPNTNSQTAVPQVSSLSRGALPKSLRSGVHMKYLHISRHPYVPQAKIQDSLSLTRSGCCSSTLSGHPCLPCVPWFASFPKGTI